MKHITKVQMTQINTRVKRGEDMADIANMYDLPIERVAALTGITRKANKKQVKAVAKKAESDDLAQDPADEFSED